VIVALAAAQVGPTWADILVAVSTAVTLLVVVVAAFVAARQLKDAAQTRHAQVMLELSRRWDESPLLESRKTWSQKTPDEIQGVMLDAMERSKSGFNSDESYELGLLASYFETMGALHAKTKRGLLRKTSAIPMDLIESLWGLIIVDAWNKWLPTVEGVAEKMTQRTVDSKRAEMPLPLVDEIWGNFGALAKELVKRQERRDLRRTWKQRGGR
jgi:hypothetical protein